MNMTFEQSFLIMKEEIQNLPEPVRKKVQHEIDQIRKIVQNGDPVTKMAMCYVVTEFSVNNRKA